MIFCLIGHSASGKSTIERKLEAMGYPRIISYTTRPPRKGEKNGVDYHFIDTTTFMEMEKAGKFAETAQYRECYYGLSLEGIDYKNKDYIVVVTIHGYEELLKVVGENHIIAIHIKVDERERMKRLLDRGDDVDEIIRRIQSDRKDFENVERVCHFTVTNDNVDETLANVHWIVKYCGNTK
jgi:guanylate kinase